MAEQSVDFIVRMIDEVTGPARDVEKGIAAVAKESKSSVADIRKLAKADEGLVKSLKKIGKEAEAADAIEAFGRSLQDAGDGAQDAESGLKGATGGLKGFAGGIASVAIGGFIVEIGTKLVGALFDAAKAFAGAALDAAEFGRTTRNTLTALAGGDIAKGAEDFRALRSVAEATGDSLEDVRENFLRARAAGLSTTDAVDFTKIRADIQATTGEGDLLFDKLRDLAKEGQVSATIFEDVAEQLGGKEILGKELGLFGLQLDNTEAGVEALDAALKNIDPEVFKTAVKNIAKARGELGATSLAAKTAGERFDSIAEVSLSKIFDDFDIGKIFGPLLKLVKPALDAIIPLIKELVDGFGESLSVAIDIVGESMAFVGDIFGTATGDGEGLKAMFRLLGQAIGLVVGIIAVAVAGVGALIAVFQAVQLFVASLVGDFTNLGGALIDGLVAGIKNAGSAVVDAMTGIVGGAIDAAKDLLGIASDSKVFAKIGEQSGSGFAGGLEGEASNVKAVSAGVVAPPPGVAGNGGGTNSVTVSIVVPGAGDPGAVAQEVQRILVSELGGAFEQIAIEVGA